MLIVSEDRGKERHFTLVGGIINWCNLFEGHNFAISMNMKNAFILDSKILILDIYFIKILAQICKGIHIEGCSLKHCLYQ